MTSAAALFAVDPAGLGGVVLQGPPGPARDGWLARLQTMLPPDTPVRRVPLHVAEGRLLGGLDLVATLRAGKPLLERGLLAQADGGIVLLAMAERVSAGTAARIAAVLDSGEVVTQRDGLERRSPATIGVVALDESIGDDEALPAALADRLAFHLAPPDAPEDCPPDLQAARRMLARVCVPDDVVESICVAAAALGIGSLRAPLLAIRAARASAALAGRDTVDADDAALAVGLVLGPRATMIPTAASQDAPEPEPEPEPEPNHSKQEPEQPQDPGPSETSPPDTEAELSQQTLPDIVLEAAIASIPAGMLDRLKSSAAPRSAPGRMGAPSGSGKRGRPSGVRHGDPASGMRLNLIETLRAAAPWQSLRCRTGPIQIHREDFRVTLLKQRSETTTIFVVDASGSAAFNRLAEAKGAIELLLADCYVRRDRVALLAFRGKGAELLLPPTRSLVRAKRSLAGLPGGGGTPLAAGIGAGCTLADSVRRQGGTPALVLLTDGQANIGQDGKPGRQAASRDADIAARRVRLAGHAALLVDTSPRPAQAGQRLADAMGAQFVALPFANAALLSRSVRAAMG